jgi:hypothetical protein
MVSSKMPSTIERNPRASMLSISNSRWCCLTSAFLGSTKMRVARSRTQAVGLVEGREYGSAMANQGFRGGNAEHRSPNQPGSASPCCRALPFVIEKNCGERE